VRGRLDLLRSPNVQESVTLAALTLLLLLVPLRPGAVSVTVSASRRIHLHAGLSAVVALALLWHATAVVLAVAEEVKRVWRARIADRRPEVRPAVWPAAVATDAVSTWVFPSHVWLCIRLCPPPPTPTCPLHVPLSSTQCGLLNPVSPPGPSVVVMCQHLGTLGLRFLQPACPLRLVLRVGRAYCEHHTTYAKAFPDGAAPQPVYALPLRTTRRHMGPHQQVLHVLLYADAARRCGPSCWLCSR
jgi:hypothetical protein